MSLMVTDITYWSNSQIVLHWLKSSKPTKRFITNRVSEISNLTSGSSWRYCPTDSNPADLLTQGITADKFLSSSLWSTSPSWLYDTSAWLTWGSTQALIQTTSEEHTTLDDNPNIPAIQQTTSRQDISILQLTDITRFSKYSKLLRVMAYIRRFINNCPTIQHRMLGVLSTQELQDAKQMLLRDCQETAYPDEVTYLKSPTSRLPCPMLVNQLLLFQDDESSGDPKVPLIHHRCQRYELKMHIHSQSQVLTLPEPSKLRTIQEPHQRHTYVSSATGAIHLEVVTNLSESTFMQVFRRFVGRKSLPKVMVSDNATTYQSAATSLRKLFQSASVRTSLSEMGTEWQFIPKRAPWYGGFWERLIGLTKVTLKKIIGRVYFTLETLQTITTQAECMINNRRLMHVPSSPHDPRHTDPSTLVVWPPDNIITIFQRH
ncbi:uncharacterized protein LOC128554206 [Mercenaria mercenaria]|uniref:uncharacterized protein LOC128554206 n=1 Tax=Mercenaria mercenaria TaxID=6596 RepID=UPI00234F2056|nr:uncharacterized protein LOC128554206 [Mercenaria mercenaria]